MRICRYDENFNENWKVRGESYIDCLYIYEANDDINVRGISEPFDIIDTNLYQAIDNNAICFKHIDYTVNKEAKVFKDIFEFEEANRLISNNIKANSCFFNIIIAT